MHPSTLALAVGLAAVAGFVDAVGFLLFGRLFVSFMSGNTTVLGIDTGHAAWVAATAPAAAIGGFVTGAFAGTVIADASKRLAMPVVLAVEAILLAGSLAGLAADAPALVAAVPLSVAMGMQNIPLSRIGETRVAMTYVTGTLVSLGRELAAVAQRRGGWQPVLIHALVWTALLGGAVGGVLAHARLNWLALTVPVGALATLAAATALRARRR